MRQVQPFLHAAVMESQTMSKLLLAKPRLLKLAAVLLNFCQSRVSQPYMAAQADSRWKWTSPPATATARAGAFLAAVVANIPNIAKDSSALAAQLDGVLEEADKFGPTRLHYGPDEMQRRFSMCLHVGLFDERVMAENPTAYLLVSHIDGVFQLLS